MRFSCTYGYDTAGNRDSSLAFGQTASYVSNSVNEYTSITGGGFQPPSPAYDDNGNATTWNLKPLGSSDLVSSVLSWDIHHRARTFATAGTTTAAVYDPLGRLTWTRVTQSGQATLDEVWSWHSWILLSRELFANSAATESFRYTWGPDLSGSLEGAGGVGGLLAIERAAANSNSWEIRHVHPDANGNTLALTDASGQPSARYRYSPFGETILSQDLDNSGWNQKNIHRFSTKPEIATTGLLYYGYRYYDPATGRWPSRDPIEEAGRVNMYGFVGNDGVNWIDILGNKKPGSGQWGTRPKPSCGRLANQLAVLVQNLKLAPILPEVFPLHPENPFQHCVWNCRMTRIYGEGYADQMSWEKELKDVEMAKMRDQMIADGCWDSVPESLKLKLRLHAENAMQPSDFRDNKTDRKCGLKVKSRSECECCCRKNGISENTPEGDSIRPYGPWAQPGSTTGNVPSYPNQTPGHLK